jgi:hypothetical protein
VSGPIDLDALVPGTTRLRHRDPNLAALYAEPGVYVGPHPAVANAMVVDCGTDRPPIAAHVNHWEVVADAAVAG